MILLNMALPEITKKKVEKVLSEFCDKRVPAHVRDKLQIKFHFKGNSVFLYEERPKWDDPSEKTQLEVAQFRYVQKDNKWSLYWRDRNLKWHLYKEVKASASFDPLLKEVDQDPTGIFWG